MADRIIIVDTWRGGEKVTSRELLQMAGRAGRKQGGTGTVDIVVGVSSYDDVNERINNASLLKVESVLAEDIDGLCFHILPSIENGEITTIDSINEWYKRSFYCQSGGKIQTGDVVKHLEKMETVETNGDRLVIKPLGSISIRMYFTPLHLFELRRNFNLIFDRELEENTFALAWAFANTTAYSKVRGDLKGLYEYASDYESQVSGYGDGVNKVAGLIWLWLLGGQSVRHLKPQALEIKKDCSRIMSALRLIFRKTTFLDKEKFFNNLESRLTKRVPEQLMALCLAGMKKSTAIELYNMGIESPDEIISNLDEIECCESKHFCKHL